MSDDLDEWGWWWLSEEYEEEERVKKGVGGRCDLCGSLSEDVVLCEICGSWACEECRDPEENICINCQMADEFLEGQEFEIEREHQELLDQRVVDTWYEMYERDMEEEKKEMQRPNGFEEITPEKLEESRARLRFVPRMEKDAFFSGGIDLDTLDEICLWGFSQRFPLRDPQEALRITKEAFEAVEKENYFEGVKALMSISGVGISRASKIIGLSDQNKLCIYDSRVGNALKDLKKEGMKIILCPPDRSFKRDFDQTTRNGWAANYERLIWTIEIMREYFKMKPYPLRAADIEMALFVMGE